MTYDHYGRLTVARFRRNPGVMMGERIPSLIMQILDELRARGIVITNRGGDWCVNVRGGSKTTAYITDDLQDAFKHGRAMLTTPPSPPPLASRRRWRRPVSAKAARRAFIKKHNRRLRARAIKGHPVGG